MILGTLYPENWICVTINHIVILPIIRVERLSHIIRSVNQIHSSKTLNRLILKLGGANVLSRVLLGMQIPSARPNTLIITEHFQTDIRNRKDKFRDSEAKIFFSRTNYTLKKNDQRICQCRYRYVSQVTLGLLIIKIH